MPGPPPVDPAIRYHAKVSRRGPDECWPWVGGIFKPSGYGRIYVGKTSTTAHRFGYKLLIGPVPDHIMVCHRCDNPPCQNPAHWFLGTHTQNMADMVAKDRAYHPRGAVNRFALLTAADVIAIREMYAAGATITAVAERFAVKPATVSNIITGKHWTQVGGPISAPNRHIRLTADDVREIRRLYATGTRQPDLAAMFSVTRENISHIVTRRSWRHVA
jgi:hypothetical protein